MSEDSKFRSGFVAILGRPNVGKSTITNYFVGEKVAIVSEKPQTTRSKLFGVVNRENTQIVFVDTPGLHIPRTRLGEFMMKEADAAKEDVDAVLVVVDATRVGPGDAAVIEQTRAMTCPKFIAVNKADLTPPEKLAPKLAALRIEGYREVVPVSALRGTNMDELLSLLTAVMPEGPKYFPDDMMTDQPERALCAEFIREKALRNLFDEIPHGIGVEMMSIQKVSRTLTEIHATIYCERPAHKGIIIGKNGAMLQKIGSEARADIEKMLDTKVMLHLWVKVREGWRDRESDLRTLGYELE